MDYIETGYPCPLCGSEWIKTLNGQDGCINQSCDIAHPESRQIFLDEIENEIDNEVDNEVDN